MRIGVNLLFMVPGEVGGSEPLLTNLVRAMTRTDHELTVFAVKGFRSAYPEIADRVELVEAAWKRSSPGVRIAAENSWLPASVRRRRLDVLHHGVGTTPYIKTSPWVVTIHDAQYRHYPYNFSGAKRAWLKTNVPHSIKKCEVTCVPSEWVRDDLISGFDADPHRLFVVPFGGSDLFGPRPSTEDEVRERYRLDRPFFMFPGRTYPHKNHRFLLEAYAPVADQAHLVLTGARWPRDREIADAARHLGLSGKVRQLGLIPRADLAGLYQGAVSLVYPTRFEGFGAPVMEAMSSGCPVIASNVTAVPEVVGDAGILLDPDDLSGWTESMSKLLDDSSVRSLLAGKGRARASEFSWERSAELQAKAYEQAAS